jgi:hypothetical protein
VRSLPLSTQLDPLMYEGVRGSQNLHWSDCTAYVRNGKPSGTVYIVHQMVNSDIDLSN